MFNDWHPLGQVSYRKWQVYDMEWIDKFNLQNFNVCGAPFGGPIAISLDNKNANPSSEYKSKVLIYTSSGVKISEISLGDHYNLVCMGWSDQEHLITLLENGFMFYDNLVLFLLERNIFSLRLYS
jgi:hypothetical protein